MAGSSNTRVCGNKVRSGCLTCKARHLKCGEEKPQCRRCITTGRTCDGYQSCMPAVKREFKRSTEKLVMIHYTPHISTALNMTISPDTQEQRSFHYFRTRTAPDLMACFGSKLWSVYVLQLAQSEPAIRHSVVAIGCLYEGFEHATLGHIADSEFALRQYNKAVQHVIDSLKQYQHWSTDIALLLCALFALFESLQGHYRSALSHITSGTKVLRERHATVPLSPKSYIPARYLDSLFSWLGSQVLEIGDISMLPDQSLKQNCMADPPEPTNFSTIEEVQDSFNMYLHKLLYVLHQIKHTISQGSHSPSGKIKHPKVSHAGLVYFFQLWSAAFDDYLVRNLKISPSSGSPCKIEMESGIQILQMWRTVTSVLLSYDLSAGETSWDRFLGDFESIIDLAASFIERNAKWIPLSAPKMPLPNMSTQVESCERDKTPLSLSSASPYPGPLTDSAHQIHQSSAIRSSPDSRFPRVIKPSFSLSLGIIPPLYVVSTRCRDPVIRRRAIHLLSICNRREGIWDSWLSSRVARHILEIEENGARQYLSGVIGGPKNTILEPIEITSALQIPEGARVVHLGTSLGPQRQGTVRYMKSKIGCDGLVGGALIFEDCFNW
jgi:Fungal specific transcription factor domain/Fungal Zn(2)-Cys(6) binuclear cluster domain